MAMEPAAGLAAAGPDGAAVAEGSGESDWTDDATSEEEEEEEEEEEGSSTPTTTTATTGDGAAQPGSRPPWLIPRSAGAGPRPEDGGEAEAEAAAAAAQRGPSSFEEFAAQLAEGKPDTLETRQFAVVDPCPVCLETPVQPMRLPCNHIFCFLCIKGAAQQSRSCALCRKEIPRGFFCEAETLGRHVAEAPVAAAVETPRWFYGSPGGGFWEYDPRTTAELEGAFQAAPDAVLELLIAGNLYLVSFVEMVQARRDSPRKQRQIRRLDVGEEPEFRIKGLSGVRSMCSSLPRTTHPTSAEAPGPADAGPADATDAAASGL